ncbi:unnamed protein product [Auanema sp. JU1783]|nr:unnamed protein product [Auanema sp. JU1783]
MRLFRQAYRVRFAPSPTGNLHLGSLRTALYNYLFAKHHAGAFILRIEDTDQARLVGSSVDQIHNVLHYYGLNEDEGPRKGGNYGPYNQSERLEKYKDGVEQLIETKHAYRCFCSEERLSLLRKDAARRNAIPKYDRKCLSLGSQESKMRAANGEKHVVRFRLDKQEVSFEDQVFGHITQTLDESDMIILKSDGFPTYHLANVIDDRFMKISHVIRGLEWLSSTGKHAILYKAFNWSPPNFVHLSLITRDGNKKLSKRDKDAFVDYYDKELGALPEAVLNLMIRNGSGIRDFETDRLYSLSQMIENFDESVLGKRNLQLDLDCLANLSRLAFRNSSNEYLFEIINNRLSHSSFQYKTNDVFLHKVVKFLKGKEERFAFLSSLTEGEFKWLLAEPSSSSNLLAKFDKETAKTILTFFLSTGVFDVNSAKNIGEMVNLPYSKVLQALRISLIDSHAGPPIAELLDFFGENECHRRLKLMLNDINKE